LAERLDWQTLEWKHALKSETKRLHPNYTAMLLSDNFCPILGNFLLFAGHDKVVYVVSQTAHQTLPFSFA
jgi:hypothetical protein